MGAEKITKSDKEWKEQLSPEEFKVTRKKGTERAFTGKYHDCKDRGTYHCICCGSPLFTSETKYESGTGWPSFWDPVSPDSIETKSDLASFSCRVLKSFVVVVMHILDMSLMTDPSQQANVTVSILQHLRS